MIRTLATAPLSARIGMVLIAAYAFVAILAPVLAPYPEAAIVGAKYLP